MYLQLLPGDIWRIILGFLETNESIESLTVSKGWKMLWWQARRHLSVDFTNIALLANLTCDVVFQPGLESLSFLHFKAPGSLDWEFSVDYTRNLTKQLKYLSIPTADPTAPYAAKQFKQHLQAMLDASSSTLVSLVIHHSYIRMLSSHVTTLRHLDVYIPNPQTSFYSKRKTTIDLSCIAHLSTLQTLTCKRASLDINVSTCNLPDISCFPNMRECSTRLVAFKDFPSPLLDMSFLRHVICVAPSIEILHIHNMHPSTSSGLADVVNLLRSDNNEKLRELMFNAIDVRGKTLLDYISICGGDYLAQALECVGEIPRHFMRLATYRPSGSPQASLNFLLKTPSLHDNSEVIATSVVASLRYRALPKREEYIKSMFELFVKCGQPKTRFSKSLDQILYHTVSEYMGKIDADVGVIVDLFASGAMNLYHPKYGILMEARAILRKDVYTRFFERGLFHAVERSREAWLTLFSHLQALYSNTDVAGEYKGSFSSVLGRAAAIGFQEEHDSLLAKKLNDKFK